ncbi:MAG: hypothetical protein ACYCTD_04810 [bacterium]
MKIFFIPLIILLAVSFFNVFNASYAYAGSCSPPTQSQLLSMTTDTEVYGALSCLSTTDLYNLLTANTLTTSQLDGVMNLLTSDQIGSLIYPFNSSQSYTFLTDLGTAETYAFLDNITANTNPAVSQAQLTYDILYSLLNVTKNGKPTSPQDLVNILTSIGQYNNTDLYNILNILNVSSKKSPGSNYLYDILYPLSSSQLYSILSLLTPTQLYNLLSNLPQKDLYHILSGVLSSTDLYNLFSGANSNIFNALVSSLKWWQRVVVQTSYWAAEYLGHNLLRGHTTPTKLPPGSQPNTPSKGNNNSFPTQSGLPGPGNGNGGGGGAASICNPNSTTGVYNCNINITITTQAPNGTKQQQSGGVSVTVASPR